MDNKKKEEPIQRICPSCQRHHVSIYEKCADCRQADSMAQYFPPIGGTGERGR